MNRQVATATEARLDAYVGEISAGLDGPRRRRAQILAELRDGLDEAVADHIANGLPPEQAATAAVAQFGAPRAIADAFAGELATAYARHTLASFVATGPLVGIWWLLQLHPHPWRTGLLALLAAIPVIPLIVVGLATAAATFATTGRLMQWLPEATPRGALAATLAVAALVATGDAALIGSYLRSGGPVRLLAVVAVAASLTRIGCSLRTIRRAVALRTRVTDQTLIGRRRDAHP